jgi:hypothetical protein
MYALNSEMSKEVIVGMLRHVDTLKLCFEMHEPHLPRHWCVAAVIVCYSLGNHKLVKYSCYIWVGSCSVPNTTFPKIVASTHSWKNGSLNFRNKCVKSQSAS